MNGVPYADDVLRALRGTCGERSPDELGTYGRKMPFVTDLAGVRHVHGAGLDVTELEKVRKRQIAYLGRYMGQPVGTWDDMEVNEMLGYHEATCEIVREENEAGASPDRPRSR